MLALGLLKRRNVIARISRERISDCLCKRKYLVTRVLKRQTIVNKRPDIPLKVETAGKMTQGLIRFYERVLDQAHLRIKYTLAL